MGQSIENDVDHKWIHGLVFIGVVLDTVHPIKEYVSHYDTTSNKSQLCITSLPSLLDLLLWSQDSCYDHNYTMNSISFYFILQLCWSTNVILSI